jgi:DinB superfamily
MSGSSLTCLSAAIERSRGDRSRFVAVFFFNGGRFTMDEAIRVNQFLMQQCRTLLRDIPDERMAEQPCPAVNHPAWILGHLAWAADGAIAMSGGSKLLPAEWKAAYGAGSTPSASRAAYPSKEELLRAVEEGYRQAREKATTASPEQLSQPSTHSRAKEMLPTFREMVTLLLTGHAGMHLGQLSSWRRMIGLPPMF